jgi:hypothetical protein
MQNIFHLRKARESGTVYFAENLDTRAYLATRSPMQSPERGLGRYVMTSSFWLYFVCLIRIIDSFGRQEVGGADTLPVRTWQSSLSRSWSLGCGSATLAARKRDCWLENVRLFVRTACSFSCSGSVLEVRTPHIHHPRHFPSDVRCTVFTFLTYLITV